MQRNPGKDSILPCKRSSSELARPGRSKQRRWPPRCISPCVRPCVPSGPPRLFPGHHLCDGRTRSEERRGALCDPATLTPGFGGAVGAARGGVGCTPEVLLARKGLDASGTLVSPPLTLISLSSTSAGGTRSAFCASGSDGPSPRRCSLSHHQSPCQRRGCGFCFCLLGHAA